MTERRVWRRGYSLDARSCEELASVITTGSACDDTFECRGAAGEVEAFLDKCGEMEQSQLSLEQALAAYTVFEKAGEPRAIYVDPEVAKWEAAEGAVADGRAKLLSICNEAVAEMESVGEKYWPSSRAGWRRSISRVSRRKR